MPPKRRAAAPRDPRRSARRAGLHHCTDAAPGLRRLRHGKGFRYVDPEGTPVRDRSTLARIRSLAIPPAYTDVWICADPQGHIQATGRDARGRKQYRYHADWHAVRGETKYHRLRTFGAALPVLRRRVDADLKARTLSREKVLAAVVALLEHSGERIGSAAYARSNKTFGLSTLRDRHARIEGTTLYLRFKGKHGLAREVTLRDRRLARTVQRCRDLPGQTLFQYESETGPRAVTSTDVNAYIREATGEDFTAKDFRTWAGTLAAVRFLAENPGEEEGKAALQRHAKALCEAVAAQLGNTVAVCRKHYIHPAVFEALEAGTFVARWAKACAADGAPELEPDEAALLRFLD